MEQTDWTEQQVVAFVRENGFPTFNERQLKRYRAEKLIEAQVVHPGFGGTHTIYRPEAGERALMVCQLLKRGRDYHTVRLRLWLSGQFIELGSLKESIWCLVPFSGIETPATLKERRSLAKKLAEKMLASAWTSVRSNLVRKILQSFERHKDRFWFLHLHAQLLYGIKIEIQYDNIGIEELAEETDIFAYGLQTQEVRVFPAKGELAAHLQQLSNGQLLSFSKLHSVLFAATEEELILARARFSMVEQLWETLDLIGQLNTPMRLFRGTLSAAGMQAWFLVFLLVLEQEGYGPKLEIIEKAVRTNLPIIKRGLAVREALERELPGIAHEVIDLSTMRRLSTEGTQAEQDAYMQHLRAVYQQHKEDLDAFWQRHPDLKGEEE